MGISRIAAVAASAAFLSTAATASTVVFHEDFDEVPVGQHINFATSADSTALDQFTVIQGSVDAYTNGGFGLPCPSLGCLDLDGTTAGVPSMILDSDPLALSAGDYRLSFNIAGNRRSSALDTVTVSVEVGLLATTSFTLGIADPFDTKQLNFSVLAPTNGNIRFVHSGPLDNFGILLDFVKLERLDDGVVIPLPAGLPLLLGGLGVLALVRRKTR